MSFLHKMTKTAKANWCKAVTPEDIEAIIDTPKPFVGIKIKAVTPEDVEKVKERMKLLWNSGNHLDVEGGLKVTDYLNWKDKSEKVFNALVSHREDDLQVKLDTNLEIYGGNKLGEINEVKYNANQFYRCVGFNRNEITVVIVDDIDAKETATLPISWVEEVKFKI